MSDTGNPEEGLAESIVQPERSDDAPPKDLAQPTEDDEEGVSYRLADPEPAKLPVPEPSLPEPPLPGVETEKPESTFRAANEANDKELHEEDFPDEPPEVTEVWSRWAEWKQPVIWMGGGLAVATLIMFGGPWVATLVFLAGLSFGAYYIVISLEVPVRVTPEQAVREFYAAAAHRLPHLHRMYALLTSDGKHTEEFADFADFRAYWKAEIARLSSSPPWLVPLEFRIEGFEHRYNGEKSLALVRYILNVSPRGRPESNQPIAQFEMHNLVVKGPDGQWYLNDGTLPEPS